jgi:trk system potassium uptake protein
VPEYRPVFLILGILIAGLGTAMLVPMAADALLGNETWEAFAAGAFLCTTLGLGVWSASRGTGTLLTARQAVIMTVGAWVGLSSFAALPLYWSGIAPTYTDAFFEAISGITTTGSTVLAGLDDMPLGILLWRSMLQWIGGIGIIVMALAILPMLHVGGMQLFKTEAKDMPDKILPRAREIAGNLTLVYVGMTVVCAIFYMAAGMDGADAIMHAMTTLATGGYSSHDASFGYFDSAAIETVSIVFMLLASLPFYLYVQAVRGQVRPFFRDTQVWAFLLLMATVIVVLWSDVWFVGLDPGLMGLRQVAFNTVSIVTTTGYASLDYEMWGPFATGYFFVLIFLGGCSASTTGGIKTFRFQVLFQELRQQVNQLIWPHGTFVRKFNRRPLPESVVSNVLAFLFLYIGSVFVIAILLSLTGLDTLTAFSGAATAVSNVGPGLGPTIGPVGNFASLTDFAKWLLAFGMLLGRLELFTVLVLFVPAFWRS